MIEILPDWIEWLFLITGMVFWIGVFGTVLIHAINSIDEINSIDD